MTKLGQAPLIITEIRTRMNAILAENRLEMVDANSVTTGKDFLMKIWRLIASVPLGIAVVYKSMPKNTACNVYYELGLMQALGKETLLVKAPGATIPSDLVRTEYLPYDDQFEQRFRAFIENLWKRAEYFAVVAEQVERNPLLALDYYRRAYLLTGDETYRVRARGILSAARLGDRAKNSVELLSASFCHDVSHTSSD